MELEAPPENQPGTQPWTCAEFQVVEDATMQAFTTIPLDSRFANSCAAVSGYRVFVHSEVHWTQNGTGIEVSGETFCSNGVMAVNNVSPLVSSLPHEMAHAVQACNALWDPPDKHDPAHQGWGRFTADADGNYVRDANGRMIWEPQLMVFDATWAVTDPGHDHYQKLGIKTGYEQ